jgi:hypothetical protein
VNRPVPRADLAIREVTEGERAAFERDGWVKLDGLLAPELAGELLAAAQEGLDAGYEDARWWWTVSKIAGDRGREPFFSGALGPQMGRNAARLINRRRLTDAEIPIRYEGDELARKLPARQGEVAQVTPFHQDCSAHAFKDRLGGVMFWIALAQVTPEHGAVRFLTGSHREGPLGVGSLRDERGMVEADTVEAYPKLSELYDLSPPLQYAPGDATAHHDCTVHGAPPNTTAEPRWSYVVGYQAGDAHYSGAPLEQRDGSFVHPTPGALIDDDERFPVVDGGRDA